MNQDMDISATQYEAMSSNIFVDEEWYFYRIVYISKGGVHIWYRNQRYIVWKDWKLEKVEE